MIDLLIQHQEGPQALDTLARMLAKPDDLDIYRYLVIALLSAHRPQLQDMVLAAARTEAQRQRRAILREALAPFAQNREVAAVLDKG